jgi:hypothetical protein
LIVFPELAYTPESEQRAKIMKSAAITRLESLLQTRSFDRTLIKPWMIEARARRLPSGVAPVDAALGGGWRCGEISEVIGPLSSGRTGVLLATLASVTSQGGLGAVVDTVDRLDPGSAAAAGCDLARVLWVRGPAMTVESARPALIDRAVRQAIRASDLIIRAGGFAVVVLDVADIPPRCLKSLPFTTWLRLSHANEGRETVGLVVGQTPVARSARGATVLLSATSRWTGGSPQSRRLAELAVQVDVRTSSR